MMKVGLAGMMLPAALLAAVPAHATQILQEGFDDVSALRAAGWVTTNESAPIGVTNWFQGNQGIFTAQSGAENSYIASNFNAVGPGGTLSNWLITPTFSTAMAGSVTFWVRGAAEEGYDDLLSFGFSNGSAVTSDFTLSAPQIALGGWNQITVDYAAGGEGSLGRFAVAHVGPEETSNYVGVDNLTITTAGTAAVPELGTWAMMLLGFGMVGFAMRRAGTVRPNAPAGNQGRVGEVHASLPQAC